jgi:UDPglucose 6-dehydrogenase
MGANTTKLMTIGFIGQGFIGKSYADDFEQRGYPVVRYSLEPQHAGNRETIAVCDVVFIAVPTPTTPGKGGDDSLVRRVLSLVGEGKIAVIKSTVLPGATESIQAEHPTKIVLHSPEFLVESTAAYDAAHPTRTIVGMPQDTLVHRDAATLLISILPKAPFELVCSSRESELIKYTSNCYLFTKVVFANIFYDIAKSFDADWEKVMAGVGADPRIGPSHLKVADASKHPGAMVGRGAGGHCLPKDFAALRAVYERLASADKSDVAVLRALEQKNTELLAESGKDLDLLQGVYGSLYNLV